MKEILDVIHDTIYQFFDVCGDDEEAPMSDKDKLLLEVNKAICNNLKTLEQEPCEDCISRQAAIDAICKACSVDDDYYECDGYPKTSTWCDELVALRALPSVTPQPKTGHWIAVENEEMEMVGYYCSECDLPMETEQRTNFCPNCGAKMRGEQ